MADEVEYYPGFGKHFKFTKEQVKDNCIPDNFLLGHLREKVLELNPNATTFSHDRGWPTYWDGEEWLYVEDNQPIEVGRRCFNCGQPPTPEGYDDCLGFIEGAWSACCGHGGEEKYIMWKGIRGWPQQIGIFIYNLYQRMKAKIGR